jgi:hypothetical protein
MSASTSIPVMRAEVPLDLRAHAVYESFAWPSDGGRLLAFLLALDRVDRWAVDFDETATKGSFDAQLQLFMAELAALVESSASELHRVPLELAEVLSHLTTTRCLYLLRQLSKCNLSIFDSLMATQGATEANATTIRRRLEVIERARLLAQIFSGERLQRILTVMGSYTDGE